MRIVIVLAFPFPLLSHQKPTRNDPTDTDPFTLRLAACCDVVMLLVRMSGERIKPPASTQKKGDVGALTRARPVSDFPGVLTHSLLAHTTATNTYR